MSVQRIHAIYFSPTGGTRNAVQMLADMLGAALALPCREVDFTLPAARQEEYHFDGHDLVILGSPVYAGRLPNKIMPDWKRCVLGEGAIAVPMVVYGNRSYGGALTEFRKILEENGFRVAGAAAVVSRHAFTDALAAGRPDEADRSEIRVFADRLAKKLMDPAGFAPMTLPPDEEILPYYTPLQEDGTPARFLKAVPETDPKTCDLCGTCREVCPMGSIDANAQTAGVCIKCQACVRRCPNGAKTFTDADFRSHVAMLEKNYARRAANAFFME